MKKTNLYLNTQPDSNDIWKELGGNYENAEQSINELVDNAISNIIGNNTDLKKIQITLEETKDLDKAIIISIEDSGLGIKNAEEALTLGKAGLDSALNEHGFGLVQALAAANKENNAWEIYNRYSEDKTEKQIMHIKAPYIMGKQSYTMEPDTTWPGHEWGHTLLRVRCNFKLFQNLIPVENAVRTSIKFDFYSVADRIYEDLGFTYAVLLNEKNLDITLELKHADGKTDEYKVTAICPLWMKETDVENKRLHIKCKHGQITPLPDRIPFNNQTSSRYYKANLTSSGVEIRMNGRVMEYNKFEEIFGKKNHPSFNSDLVQVDIVSESREFLPATRTTKNGFRVGDERLTEVYKWLRKSIDMRYTKNPKPVKVTEIDYKKKLMTVLQNNYIDTHSSMRKPTNETAVIDYREEEVDLPVMAREHPVFKQILKNDYPKIDLFVDNHETVSIIEAKKETASIIDLYQLLMYCDGYYLDNEKMPDEAILVAKNFPNGLKRVMGYLNEKNKGRYPEICCKLWDEYQENFGENLRQEKMLKMKKE